MYSNNRKGIRMKFTRYAVTVCVLFAVLFCETGCRRGEDEPEKEKISSIEFDKPNAAVKIGEETTVRVTAKSDEAKHNETIAYTATDEGYIEIKEASNDGFIIRGLKGGSTVIVAKSEKVTAYFQVRVERENILTQYISVAQPVIELKEGDRVSTQVSLYGGNALDNPGFVWNLETGKNNIGISSTDNIAVISGLQRGHQKITVSHPKAEFTNEILVFVRGVDEEIKYLTSGSNVLMMPNDGQYHDFDVVLINGISSDVVNIQYSIAEGEDIIEISGSQTKCNVLAKRSGTAVVRVSHPLAAADFDVRVIVYDTNTPYIVLDKTFVLLSVSESVSVSAAVENARNGVLHKNQFTKEIFENNEKIAEENSIIEIQQTNESFWIRGRRGGTARVVISNAQAEVSREVLVVVRDEAILIDDYYFTTTQNIITTQVGDDSVFLRVQLINGTSAEANRFVWEIDDGTVAGIYAHHGVAKGNRAMVTAFEGVLEITPKKPGTAKIKITNEHEKYLLTSATVIVKVYPAGTFAQPPVQVGYNGLIKVEYGSPQTILLNKIPPNLTDAEIGTLDWSIEDTGIATLYTSAHSISNIVSAARSVDGGITKMKVEAGRTGGRIEFPHESVVIAGSAEYIDSVNVIYVDNTYQKVTEQQQVTVPVLNSKYAPKDAELWYPNQFTVQVANPEYLYAVMVKNRLILQGKLRGETDVIVSHPEALNGSITLHVRVEPMAVSIDQPYYFRVPEIVGIVRGFPVTIGKAVNIDGNISTGDLRVEMVGAPESESAKIVWSSEDSSVVTIRGNGSTAVITGNAANTQTKIWVRHKDNKAEERFILVYVVANTEDLKKVAIGSGKGNYLLTTGQRQLITVITNANDEQKKYIKWEVIKKPGDPDVITIENHFDSAMVEATAAGNAEIKVWYEKSADEKSIVPLSLYVSVVDALSGDKVIKGPPIIGLVKGESKFVSVEHINLTQDDLNRINWEVIVSDGGGLLANYEGNGDSAYLYGLRRGIGKVKISQSLLNYEHYATLVCAETAEELASMYVMGVDQSYHQMMTGEEKKIKLAFGSNGFPETAKKNLVWTAGSSGAVRVAGSGESVSIVAQEPGECTVTVTDANDPQVSFNKTIELKFLVRAAGESTLEFRGHQKIVGIVTGEKAQVEMRLFDGDSEVKNYALWEHENNNDNIIKVNRIDNILDIEAKAVGESYVTVIYNKGQKDEARAKILVYTAQDADALRAYYPVLIEKTNYLLQIGQSAVIKIETMEEKDSEHFRYISWGIENANVIESVDFNGKKQETVRGRAEGQCVLTVNYNNGRDVNKIVGKIFITVVGNDVIDLTKYIVTDNIIGLVNGESKTTKIFHNLGGDVSAAVWESLNPGVVTVSGTGEEATLTAAGLGETYVTVSYGSWLKRHILVYVCDTKAQADAYKAMNMECRYYRAGTGETIVLPVYFAPNKSATPTLWTDRYENKVVKFTSLENGAKVEIETLNEGVAVLEAANTGLSNPSGVLRIYIEVSKKYNGAAQPVVTRYLTAAKTVYVLNPDNRDEELNLRVSGVGYTADQLKGVEWEVVSGGNYVDIFPNGQDCTVRANLSGLEGKTELKASLFDNDVTIKVVVSKTGLMGFPYIIGQDTIHLGLGVTASVEYDVAEADEYDKSRFHAEVIRGWDVVGENTKFEGNVLKVEGKKTGQAVLKITCVPVCSPAHYKEVLVTVTTTGGPVYLTTRDNFSLVKIDEVKTLNVEMVGYNNPGDGGYDWVIAEEDKKYLEFSWTGKQAQVKGKKEGAGKTVMITVSNAEHVNPMFNIRLFVRISNNYVDVKYLTTRQNIVTVAEGRSVYVTAELVGGGPGEESQIKWSSDGYKDYADAQGMGTQGVVFGHKEGLARVRASYQPAINGFVEILVIVEKDTTADGIYITSPDTLVELKPGDTKQISARLVGNGVGAGDEYGFQWRVYNSATKLWVTSNEFVEIIGSASGTDRIFIKGLKEGEATVKVSHPAKTRDELELKVYVQSYNKVEFSRKSIELDDGKDETVYVTMPPDTMVRYSAGKYKTPGGGDIDVVRLSSNVAGSSGWLVITGINPGVCVITATGTKSNGLIMTDEMVVTVRAVNNRLVQYITTNDSIFNMVNFQSSENRLMISASAVGEKAGGGQFTEADSANVSWEIANENNSRNYIEFDNGGISTRGKYASIKPKSVGTATVSLKHENMAGYEKRIYVNVNQYDGNFLLNPTFTSMLKGGEGEYSVTINRDVKDSEYDNVVWSVGTNEDEEEGIYIRDKDGKGVQSGVTGQKAKIAAKKPGVYKIYAQYKSQTQEGTVYVEPERVLEVCDDSVIQIVPGHLRFIGLKYAPLLKPKEAAGEYKYEEEAARYKTSNDGLGKEFTVKVDSTRYLDVVYAGPIYDDSGKERIDLLPSKGYLRNIYDGTVETYDIRNAWNDSKKREITQEGYNAVLVVKGKEDEGYTRITVTHNQIERAVTVRNSSADVFYMEGVVENGKVVEKKEVRGQPASNPNQRVTIKYNIIPEKTAITPVTPDNGYPLEKPINENHKPLRRDTSGIKVVDDIRFDYENQLISFRLNHSGYTVLEFENEIFKDYPLRIPVYVYYDKIDIDWKMGYVSSRRSRIDSIDNVVYIANKDSVYLYFSNPNDYYGNDFEIVSINAVEINSKKNINGKDLINASIDNGRVYITGNNEPPNANNNLTDSLLSVEYVGVLTVTYKFSDGKKNKNDTYKKNFLIYAEQWLFTN